MIIFPPKIITSADIAINRLFPERYFSQSCNRSFFLYFLPLKTELDFRDRRENNNFPEITDMTILADV